MTSLLGQKTETRPSILELLHIQMRNTQDSMVQRTAEFFSSAYFPALQRAGAGPAGAFNSLIAQDSPFLLLLLQFSDLSAWDASRQKMMADKEYAKARESYGSGPLPYLRYERTLLRGFPSFPAIEVPEPLPGPNKVRTYEVRTYESNTPGSLARKVKMFDDGEIAIFRKVGMVPVFFGETLIGRNMPNLVYMVGFEDLAARERIWSAFISSPDWQKLRAQPGLSDGEIVSNISNSLVRPTAFSAIR
ncbi:MAG: NIPSNAP family protein [Bryobacteraceae bacterium]|nr:NIPSNAP family protein [Bryobacteraceae bacterium]